MHLHFWGAAGEVTGSCHFLEIGDRRLMLDAGLVQGHRKQAFEANRKLPWNPNAVDAAILSHAHLDHCGNLPTWVRNGYRNSIHSTPATRDLCSLMLPDSAHIQKNDVERVNRKKRSEGRHPFEVLYEIDDCTETLELFETHTYHRWFQVLPGIRAQFLDAGHMLGSGVVVLDIEEHGTTRRIAFSGDIGHGGSPLLRSPEIPEGVEALIVESTYGNRLHPPRSQSAEELFRLTADVIHDGGKLLIPAFAVGRTQEVVFELNKLFEDGKLPFIKVFVDSPLAVNVTEVFRLHYQCFNDAVRQRALAEADADPFGFSCLTYVRDAQVSRMLNTMKEPAVIIAASGMCEAGRILHHLKNHVHKKNTTVLFVGFQAEHTLGRKLLDGINPVPILGDEIPVAARLIRQEGFSGHADRNELLDWIDAVRQRGNLQKIFLVHGEDEPRAALAEGLAERGMPFVYQPKRGNRHDI
jgi:metallo-beta-lactamase family protein